jgi:FG-GAP repeat protein
MRSRRRILRGPRAALVLLSTVAGVVAFSSSAGSGALPASTLPVYGVTSGEGSRATVAELGDVDRDGASDYAVGMPYADANGPDSGIVYVFLGPRAEAPASLDVRDASFRIVGHAGELLGFAVAGGDVNADGYDDIAIGAPMAGAPSRSGGGAAYVVFGSAHPADLNTLALSGARHTNGTDPAPHSPLGSRYDGFQQDSHMGVSIAVLPDVDGDGYADVAVGAPDADLHRPGGGGVAVLHGKASGEHISLTDLWSDGYPYFFHVDFPSLDDQHVGESVAAVPDMTGDGWPDLVLGAPQADPGGRTDAGSVWIISGHLAAIDAGCSGHLLDATCPWIKLNALTPAQGYRIDGAVAGEGLGSSLAAAGDQNGDGLPDLAIGASAASPAGRTHAGEVVVMAGQAGSATRDTASALERIAGPSAGAGLGAALAAAGDIDGDGRIDLLAGAPGEAAGAGAAYFVRGLPGAAPDLAQGGFLSRIPPPGAGAQTGSAVAAAPGGALVAAPGANGGAGGAYAVPGSGRPAAAAPPAATAPVAPAAPGVASRKPCRPDRPRAKAARARPGTCPLRMPAHAKPRARGGHARSVQPARRASTHA